jgi:ubiquinone/menaquinone biosynthesis C-methylase UbiE
MGSSPPVCDYEGSDYYTRFWQGHGRDYEDRVERIALRRLLPPTGSTLIEVGAGFGRLANEYAGYEKVVLFDYSRSLLREAQTHLGDDPRFIYVAGNWYNMPFVDGLFNTLVQIRTIHHAANVPQLLQQLTRIAHPTGTYILEFANKQNLKAILRFLVRQQRWSPFALEPVEFVELNYNFHPRWIQQQLESSQFSPNKRLTVSHYRFNLIKKLIPTGILVFFDSLAQWTGNWWQISPSVFVQSQHVSTNKPAEPHTFFACPTCFTPLGQPNGNLLTCENTTCRHQWRYEGGLYDFKEPVSP